MVHARATDLLRGVDLEAGWPEPRAIAFRGRRPWFAPASFFGEVGEGDQAGVWTEKPVLRPEFRAETKRNIDDILKSLPSLDL